MMEIFPRKIPRRLLNISIIAFVSLFLMIGLIVGLLNGKAQINETLILSQQNRLQLQRTSDVNEALLNVELKFKSYCITYDRDLYDDYRYGVSRLHDKISLLFELDEKAKDSQLECVGKMLEDKELESKVYFQLRQISDSLMLSSEGLSMLGDRVEQRDDFGTQVRVDTISITESTQGHRSGLLGKLIAAFVGEKVHRNVNTKVVVPSGLRDSVGNGLLIEKNPQGQLILSVKVLAAVDRDLKQSELSLVEINNQLLSEIQGLVVDILKKEKTRNTIQNEAFLNLMRRSTKRTLQLLIVAILFTACLVGYTVFLAYKNGMIQAEISELNKRLKDDLIEKDKFLSIMGHDLRNPFNALLGFCGILQISIEDGNLAEISDCADIVKSSAQRIYNLLDNLLIWSQVTNGKVKFMLSTVNVDEFIQEHISTMLPMAQNKGVSLIWDVETGISLQLDRNMFGSVLQNLVTNAIKFTPRGGQVILSACTIDGKLQINVADNGVGMTEDQLNKIFTLDRGAHSLGTDNEEGTGLSLMISKEFVEMHGGTLNVESVLGRGSRFTCEIPIVGQI